MAFARVEVTALKAPTIRPIVLLGRMATPLASSSKNTVLRARRARRAKLKDSLQVMGFVPLAVGARAIPRLPATRIRKGLALLPSALLAMFVPKAQDGWCRARPARTLMSLASTAWSSARTVAAETTAKVLA